MIHGTEKITLDKLPKVLYHGSAFKQKELKPGFKRTGVIQKWDEVESNEYLYLTTDKNTALALGFMSTLSKVYDCKKAENQENQFTITLYEHDGTIKLQEIQKLPLYIYTVIPNSEHWIKNNNAHNGISTEYKTKSTLTTEIQKCETIDLKKWLVDKKLNFKISKGESVESLTLEMFLTQASIPKAWTW